MHRISDQFSEDLQELSGFMAMLWPQLTFIGGARIAVALAGVVFGQRTVVLLGQRCAALLLLCVRCRGRLWGLLFFAAAAVVCGRCIVGARNAIPT